MPHISDMIGYLSFSFWPTSLSMIISCCIFLFNKKKSESGRLHLIPRWETGSSNEVRRNKSSRFHGVLTIWDIWPMIFPTAEPEFSPNLIHSFSNSLSVLSLPEQYLSYILSDFYVVFQRTQCTVEKTPCYRGLNPSSDTAWLCHL